MTDRLAQPAAEASLWFLLRDGIEKLLKADWYRVTLAPDEKDAIESAQRVPLNLIW